MLTCSTKARSWVLRSPGADGSFQILTGITGRFYLVVSAKSFRQLETPGFYAGRLDNIERNMVLEPEWVRESIVVTATGTPTPQAQTSAATSVLGPSIWPLADDLVSALRLMPGTFVGAGWADGRAGLAVHPRWRLGLKQDSLRWREMPAIWAADSILALFRPLPLRAPKSIADRTPISMARMRAAAWSA